MISLYIDATRGASALGVLAALVDAGIPSSPILHHAHGLGLPIDLRIDASARGATAETHPPLLGTLVRTRDVDALFARAGFPPDAAFLAADALGRLLGAHPPPRADGEACVLQVSLDAGVVTALGAAALAITAVRSAEVLVSRVGVEDDPSPLLAHLVADEADALAFGAGDTTPDGAALLRALSWGWGREEPRWEGPVARGRSGGATPVRVAWGAPRR